jgi:hypothetical protein
LQYNTFKHASDQRAGELAVLKDTLAQLKTEEMAAEAKGD